MTKITTDLIQQPASGSARDVSMVIAVNADGSPISGGGGSGGGGTVEVSNFPATQPVTGPLTNAQFTAVEGTAAAAAWAGTGNGTVVAILKAIHAQNAQVIDLLEDIELNTRTPVDP